MREIAVDSPDAGASDAGTLPPNHEIRAALARVVASGTFSSAPRLQQFLAYIVEETIAGRGAAIKGKAIAVDVYGRELDGTGGQNLVRVEARRLRRRLKEYYTDERPDDPLQIVVDLGGYSPRFEPMATDSRPTGIDPVAPDRSGLLIKALLAAAAVLLGTLAIRTAFDINEEDPEVSSASSEAIRAAYRERSVQSVQAVNLAEQARGMFFPVFDLQRQQIALDMYRHAIELDPGLHHGYSGAAQVLATLALLTVDSDSAAVFLQEATTMADRAVDLGPSDPWAIAAKGLVMAVSEDTESAMKLVRIAVDIAPQDGHVLDLAGVTSILASEPRFAAETSDPARPRSGVGRFGANNIWGLSKLMLGDYKEVIEAFSTAPEDGVPVSAPSLVFLAVAYDHLEAEEEASRVVKELDATWPEFPIRYIVARIFRSSPAFGDDIVARLAKYGYQQD